jgi:hypothetical protein
MNIAVIIASVVIYLALGVLASVIYAIYNFNQSIRYGIDDCGSNMVIVFIFWILIALYFIIISPFYLLKLLFIKLSEAVYIHKRVQEELNKRGD